MLMICFRPTLYIYLIPEKRIPKFEIKASTIFCLTFHYRTIFTCHRSNQEKKPQKDDFSPFLHHNKKNLFKQG